MQTNGEHALIFQCPHCRDFVEISRNEINCRIFRHGVFKNTFEQINPHSSKYDCDKYSSNDMIFGCGKPFMLVELNAGNNYTVVKCDYI
jgi:hypothetical protein